MIDRLGGAGVSLVDESTEPTDDRLDGLTIVITGTLDGYSRDAAKAAVEDRGGKVTGSVSRNTSALVAGENAGSKLVRAEELSIPVLDEAAFERLLDEGPDVLG